MTKIISYFFVCLVLFLPIISAADVTETQAVENLSCEQLRTAGVSDEIIARRGCCSHHGGVCGCSGDRQKCCDGSLSPSCMCGEKYPSSDLDILKM